MTEIRQSDPSRQKDLRRQLRSIGFYISDFTDDNSGFTASEVDRLISRGAIQVERQVSSGAKMI